MEMAFSCRSSIFKDLSIMLDIGKDPVRQVGSNCGRSIVDDLAIWEYLTSKRLPDIGKDPVRQVGSNCGRSIVEDLAIWEDLAILEYLNSKRLPDIGKDPVRQVGSNCGRRSIVEVLAILEDLAILEYLNRKRLPDIGKDPVRQVGSNCGRRSIVEDLDTTLLRHFELFNQAPQHNHRKAQYSRWVERLKEAYYDAEDTLDGLEYERLRRKVESKLSGRLCPKLIIKPLAKFVNPAFKRPSLLYTLKKKLLDQLKKLNEIAAEAKTFHDLHGIHNTESKDAIITGNNSAVTSSFLIDKVFGRDGDRDEIINFLLDKEGDRSNSVVAVTGIGGVGKTTLAQYVYNDERVKNHFGVRMWLCVSKKFNIINLLKEMIECASEKECPNLSSLDVLQDKLMETLPKSDNIMVVLDDVWYDSNDEEVGENKWENLLKPLIKFASRGGTCKIVVTSRSTSFPFALLPGKLIELSSLAPNDFISLLRYHAIDGLQIDDPQLKNDLSDMVDKLSLFESLAPLVAKVVGNQLRERPDIEFWQATLGNVNLSTDGVIAGENLDALQNKLIVLNDVWWSDLPPLALAPDDGWFQCDNFLASLAFRRQTFENPFKLLPDRLIGLSDPESLWRYRAMDCFLGFGLQCLQWNTPFSDVDWKIEKMNKSLEVASNRLRTDIFSYWSNWLQPFQTIPARYRLSFINKIEDPTITTDLLRDKDGDPINVAIYDTCSQSTISLDSSLSSAKVIHTVLDAELCEETGEDWTFGVINPSMCRERIGKRPPLIGPNLASLHNEVASFNPYSLFLRTWFLEETEEDWTFISPSMCRERIGKRPPLIGPNLASLYNEVASFNLASLFLRTRFLRGVRVMGEGERIHEGVNEPFQIKDRGGKASQTWGLLEPIQRRRIGEKYHASLLQKNNIKTVKGVLKLYYNNESALCKILCIKSESDKVWKSMVEHAMQCANEFQAKYNDSNNSSQHVLGKKKKEMEKKHLLISSISVEERDGEEATLLVMHNSSARLLPREDAPAVEEETVELEAEEREDSDSDSETEESKIYDVCVQGEHSVASEEVRDTSLP